MRIGVLTVSDKGFRGERVDTSGPAIQELLAQLHGNEVLEALVPDNRQEIALRLRAWADDHQVDVIFTTGGTGLSPSDVTPDATQDVIDSPVPGVAEAIRAEGMRTTPMAMLSRAICGVRGTTLIINLPGSEWAVRESVAVLIPVLAHAVDSIQGLAGDHRASGADIVRE
ncbi:MAG: MogA/MoaB family molybdenum cofactor biosynthesis protein [Dehalococcoidia bacterium]|nr:MogA/MoaB family molybdenum cofactor biosynthesis protein [Dehalococcoidia bacterium]